MRFGHEQSETQEPMSTERNEGRAPHLRLLRGGKARPVSAAFAYPRSAALTYDTRSDARTREAVCDALRRNEVLDASGIDVYVANGEVTLIGMVADVDEERIAVAVAAGCEGVREAVSQLQIAEDGGREEWVVPVA